jgi:hypothetical protein
MPACIRNLSRKSWYGKSCVDTTIGKCRSYLCASLFYGGVGGDAECPVSLDTEASV